MGGRQRAPARRVLPARTADENPELEVGDDGKTHAPAPSSANCGAFVAGRAAVIRVNRVARFGARYLGRCGDSAWQRKLEPEALPAGVRQRGRSSLCTYCQRVWDAADRDVDVHAVIGAEESVKWFEASHVAAQHQGERIFTELSHEHRPTEGRTRALRCCLRSRGQGNRANRLARRA